MKINILVLLQAVVLCLVCAKHYLSQRDLADVVRVHNEEPHPSQALQTGVQQGTFETSKAGSMVWSCVILIV